MKKHIATFYFLISFFILSAQNNSSSVELFGKDAANTMYGAEQVWIKQDNIIPTFMRFNEAQAQDETTFLFHLKKQFHLPSNYTFKQIGIETDEIGYTHKRFQILVNEVPVNNGIFLLHIKAGKVLKFNGYLFKNITTNTTPNFSENSGLNFALSHIGADKYKWQLPSEEAFIKKEKNDPSATFYPKGELVIEQLNGDILSNEFILCWKYDIYAHEPMGRYTVYVNAMTGSIVNKNDRICHTDANGTATTVYRGIRPIITDSTSPTNFRLREAARGLGIRTFNMLKGTNYGAAVDFLDSNNVWNNINVNKDQYATDAHWGAEKTYDFYLSKGRNSIDNAGFQLNLYVHYSTNYVNAYWDGTRMTFGDGNTTYNPLVSLDITGHEITHGLTENTANLTYAYESGALNESFSDVFGTAIEQYADSTLGNWLIGEDIGGAFRSMSNPNLYNNPDTYLGTWWYTGTADNGGVHTNSGVQNFWFYLLTQGGSGTNDIGNAYNVTGLGKTKANNIAWRNLTVYLTSGSNYADARYYAIQSALDLYGPCSPEVASTTNAWYAVGVGTVYSPFVDAQFVNTPTVSCAAPFTVTFSNRSVNATSFTWHFGDGATSTLSNPSHTYNTLGTYTVKLISDGGLCGLDSIIYTNLVNIDSNNACITNMPGTGTGITQTACLGILYDNGGATGNYTDNLNSTITIAPTGATSVSVSFSKFRLESGYDFLFLYDGPSTASPLIGTYSGFTLPPNVTSSGSSITIKHTSDISVVDSGFAMNWSCNKVKPNANFTATPNPACPGQNITFTNTTTNSPVSYQWILTGATPATSTAANPVVSYATTGTYTVTLIATNAYGSDTLTRVNYISITNGTILPISNGFTSSTFPPTDWSIVNTNASTTTWARSTTVGRTPTTGNSMFFNNFSYDDRGNNDEVRMQKANLAGLTNATLTFDVAYAPKNATTFDGLQVLVSTDCGSTFTVVYNKSNTTLATAPATSSSFTPTAAQWRNDTVNLNTFIGNPNVIVSFKNIAGFANRLYIDNINLFGTSTLLPTANYTATSTSICQNNSVTFTNSSSGSPTSYSWTFSGGTPSSSTATNPTVTYNTPGNYNVQLIATNAGGSDTILATNYIHVFSTSSGSFSQSICAGSSYLFNGINRTTSGAYLDTLTNYLSCDSFVTLNLTVRPTSSGLFSQSICAGSSYLFNGINRTTSGAYLDTLTNYLSCDSFVTLNLTVSPTSSGSFSQSICAGSSYLFNGINRTTSGAYLDTLTNYLSCDSFVTLNLTVSPTSSGSFSQSICAGSSYLFNGINRTTSGAYLDTLTNYLSCDSFVTLNLTVSPTSSGSFSQSICAGSSYLFNGINRTTSGAYLDTLTNYLSCDSFVTLNLTVSPTSSGSFSQSICAGSFYLFNGINRTTSGAYLDTLTNYLSCDSFVTLNLTVSPTSSGSFSQSICAGSSYLFNGINRTTSGAYLDTLTNYLSCDSFVTLNLTVSPTSSGSFSQSICAGSSYLFNGINRTTSGAYLDTLTNYLSCDSFVTLNLTVSPTSSGSFSQSICAGSSYLFNGINRTTSGAYLDTLTNYLSCDSFVTLNLTVSSLSPTLLTHSICTDSSYLFNGIILNTAGIYLDTLSSISGCDSIISLNLSIIPCGGIVPNNNNMCTAFNLTVGVTTPSPYNAAGFAYINTHSDTVFGNNSLANMQPGEPIGSCGSSGLNNKTLWYKLITSSCGASQIIISTDERNYTNFDTRISVYRRNIPTNCNGSYTEIACNDNGIIPSNVGITNNSTVILTPNTVTPTTNEYLPGETVYIQASGVGNASGNYGLIIDIDPVQPTVNSITASTANIDWNTVNTPTFGAVSGTYVQWRPVGSPSTVAGTWRYINSPVSNYTLTGLLPGVTYEVWTSYVCGNGGRWWSRKVLFTTSNSCSATTIAAPIISTISGTCTSATISFTASGDYTTYRIKRRQVGRTGISTSPIFYSSISTQNYNWSGLIVGASYEFWIEAYCGTTLSYTSSITLYNNCVLSRMSNIDNSTQQEIIKLPNGNISIGLASNQLVGTTDINNPNEHEVQFEILSANLIEEARTAENINLDFSNSNENDFSIHPNPASTEATISYTLPNVQSVLYLYITDALGNLIINEQFTNIELTGNIQIPFDKLQSGIYFVSLKAANYQQTNKLIIQSK